ncbi:MAG: hypothetical protein JW384_02017 [Nitrosomonadaceae bacterium]|nr:hypothetical protein [Nitrosomonadaceae bacterium]
MKAYIMLIMLLQMDPDDGLPYITAMQQSPIIEYSTLSECDTASAQKRTAMLSSSLGYPDLMIVDILIQCVASSELDFDINDITI